MRVIISYYLAFEEQLRMYSYREGPVVCVS